MRIEGLRLIGSVGTILVILLLLSFLRQGFTPFEYSRFQMEEITIPVGVDTGPEVGRLVWGARQLDMIAMGVLLFVAATGCTSVLRSKRDDTK